MDYPISASDQLRPVLRALRKSKGLTQAQVGKLLGVNQKRVAAIEKTPGVTGFDQLARLVAALGGRLVVQAPDLPQPADASASKIELEEKDVGSTRADRAANFSLSVEGCLD